MEKSKKKYSIGMLLFHILSFSIVLFLIYLLVMWNIENDKNRELQESAISDANITIDTAEVNGTKIDSIKVDFDSLLAQNKDTVGWIKVNNTNINYPVVQSTTNNYYLKHGFDQSFNNSGSIFADCKNNLENFDQNTIIYGHNRRDGSMFSSLNSTLQESWYGQFENQFIHFNTISKTTIWEIFSIYKEKARNITNSISFSSETEFLSYVHSITHKSIHNFNVTVNPMDKILTLYTCGNNTSYRVIVHAKLIYEN